MRNFHKKPPQRRDHFQELTDTIVAALEAGIAPWRRPWDPNACGASTTPVNAATGIAIGDVPHTCLVLYAFFDHLVGLGVDL